MSARKEPARKRSVAGKPPRPSERTTTKHTTVREKTVAKKAPAKRASATRDVASRASKKPANLTKQPTPVLKKTPARQHDDRVMRRELNEVRKRFRIAKPVPFDADEGSGHWFELRLPSTPDGEAVLVEIFAPGSGGGASAYRGLEIPKGRLSLAIWLAVDDRIRAEFNGRRDRRNETLGAWGSGTNRMSVPLGWELSLFFWGAEGARSPLARRIFSVWSSLVPEERWWLYNQAAALGGTERDHNHVWRRALRLIFLESGASGSSAESVHLPLPRPAGLTEKRRRSGS